jgi:predicted aspartyl protease
MLCVFSRRGRRMGQVAKTRMLALALGALCGSAAGGEAGSADLTPHSGTRAAADGTQALTIATTPERSDRILARVMVNGRGPYRFMVDTGANHTALAASMLPALGISADGNKTITVLGINGSVIAPSVHLDSLDAGGLHLSNLQVPVLAGPLLADIDGILGIDGLENKTMTANFLHDRFVVTGSLGGVPIGDVVVSGRLISQHLLEVDCRVNGVKAKAVIDTGSPRTLANWALLRALAQKSGPSASSIPTEVVDATEALQAAVIEPVSSMQIDAATISNLYVTFGTFRVFKTWGLEDQPAVLVGMDLLGSFAEISIDYRRKELGIYPRADMISLK